MTSTVSSSATVGNICVIMLRTKVEMRIKQNGTILGHEEKSETESTHYYILYVIYI